MNFLSSGPSQSVSKSRSVSTSMVICRGEEGRLVAKVVVNLFHANEVGVPCEKLKDIKIPHQSCLEFKVTMLGQMKVKINVYLTVFI